VKLRGLWGLWFVLCVQKKVGLVDDVLAIPVKSI
jgi:hypothetical protein